MSDRSDLIEKALSYYPYPRHTYKNKSTQQILAMVLRAENKHMENKSALKPKTDEELEAEARAYETKPRRITVNGIPYIRLDNGQYKRLTKDDE